MAKKKEPLEKTLDDLRFLSDSIKKTQEDIDLVRQERDQLFLKLYMERAITVTEMARVSGIRRESVHEAINRAKAAA